MVVLGIDPGLRVAGYALIKKDQQKSYLIVSDCLMLKPTDPIEQRIKRFYDFFTNLVAEHNVTVIALETPFLGKNTQSFLKLGYLRGMVYLIAAHHGIILYEFSPREVKQAVTGFGGASKEQVCRVMQQFFPGLNLEKKKLDVADALAITLCGIWGYKKGTKAYESLRAII